MEVTNMKRIERSVKYLAEHMDEYTYEEFTDATQNILDDARNTVFDKYFCECTLTHLKNLMSLYRYLKMGQYN